MISFHPACSRTRLLIAVICLLSAQTFSFSQIVPVGSVFDETLRNMQLAGKLDSTFSLSSRPFVSGTKGSLSDIYAFIDRNDSGRYNKTYRFAKKGIAGLLPFSLTQQYNTSHPYGWNDGGMIAAKGYQLLLTAGAYASYGPLDIQLQPEIVYAANPRYQTNADYGPSAFKSYNKIYPGQSTIRLSSGVVSVGLSSQNLWWGPGIHSSLLMSNNAPGFIHGFFSSRRPMKTGIGSFEWQLIGAKITTDNKNDAFENFNLHTKSFPVNSRYLSAFMVTYQPKWVPGLFLGVTRGLQRYRNDIDLSGKSFFNKYIPVLTKPLEKASAQADDTMRTDQLASFFTRWVLLKAHAEFYVEYGFNDYNQNVRDYVLSPFHSAAYLVGFKKLVFLNKPDSYLDFGFEMTQMSQTPDYLVRSAGNWYIHTEIVQGYTHNNQIMGAGAGLGSNVQSLTAKWISGWKQLGILLERVERDPVYHSAKWTDFSLGITPQYKYKDLVFSGIFQFINSTNYAWEKDVNRFNLHSRIAVQYLF